jgi:hypothetical protein
MSDEDLPAFSAFGRSLYAFTAASFSPPQGPARLWSDHASRSRRELPMWMVSTRQVGIAAAHPLNVAYRMARVANVVALTHNLCLTLDPLSIEAYLANLDPDVRGFAVEGVGMGLFTRELAAGEGDLLQWFLAGPATRFSGLAFTGIGLSLVHNRQPFDAAVIGRWQGLSRWMVLDGLGFWGARQDWTAYGRNGETFPGVNGPQRAIFDRGLGRSAWFENGADVAKVAAWLLSVDVQRRRDTALGVGVAATFTGGVEAADLTRLRDALPEHAQDFAAGSANAAATRVGAGIDTAYTDRACRVLTGLSAPECFEQVSATRAAVHGDRVEDVIAVHDRLRAVLPAGG